MHGAKQQRIIQFKHRTAQYSTQCCTVQRRIVQYATVFEAFVTQHTVKFSPAAYSTVQQYETTFKKWEVINLVSAFARDIARPFPYEYSLFPVYCFYSLFFGLFCLLFLFVPGQLHPGQAQLGGGPVSVGPPLLQRLQRGHRLGVRLRRPLSGGSNADALSRPTLRCVYLPCLAWRCVALPSLPCLAWRCHA